MVRTKLTEDEILAQLPAATEVGRIENETEPRARSVRYDPNAERIEVELVSGCLFAFPVARVEALRGATPEQLSAGYANPDDEGLHWEALDVDIALPGLIADLVNMDAWAAKYMGRKSTPAKARAARENGKKGGRPRKGRDAA